MNAQFLTHGSVVRACAAAACASLLGLLGCNEVLGIEEPLDTDSPVTTGGSNTDVVTTTTATTGTGGTRSGTGGAGGSGAGGSGSPGGQGGSSNGAGPDGGGRTIEFAWAEWPMPNPVTTGLPYPQNYDTTSTAGVVGDKVTNLKWQQTVEPNAFNWVDARTYCATLSLAGGGWRLPSRIELLSIVDFTNPNPVIDARVFPGTPQARFWTASPVADESTNAWTIDFGFGNGLTTSSAETSSNRVRCVR